MEKKIDHQAFGVTPSLFLEWRSPRFGNNNPTKVNSKVWEWLFHSKLSGYASTQQLKGPSSIDNGPTCSFDRFGQSVTELPDGRVIYIGGEHEDHYDPDFYIYNDIVVVNTDNTIDFYCYSKTDFSPTDFHTSSLVKNKIVIIGSLGYPEDRLIKETQIFLLDIENFKMQKINTSGKSPGWIHDHNASLSLDNKSIILTKGKIDFGQKTSLKENIDDWKLNLEGWHWECIRTRNWIRWEIKRCDKNRIHLWDIRQALWSLEANWEKEHNKEIEELESELGYKPNVSVIKDLYVFQLEQDKVQEDDEYNIFWTYINEVRVRFNEKHYYLQVSVEGVLPDKTIHVLKDSLLTKISHLENTECEIEIY